MSEFYGLYMLLHNKNKILLTKTEKDRVALTLSETKHFKEVLSPESKKHINQIYKYANLYRRQKNSFIYHQHAPDKNMYTVLSGRVVCFVPHSAYHISSQQAWEAELKDVELKELLSPNSKAKAHQDDLVQKSKHETAQKTLDAYKNIEDEAMLSCDIASAKLYFQGATCLFKKLRDFNPGESFGVYTSYHYATFVAACDDTALLSLSAQKYAKLFKPEVERFNFLITALAGNFCKNEEKVVVFSEKQQNEERRRIRNLGRMLKRDEEIVSARHLLDQYILKKERKTDVEDGNEEKKENGEQEIKEEEEIEEISQLQQQSDSRSDGSSIREKNGVIGWSQEEKMKGVAHAFECTQLPFCFEKIKLSEIEKSETTNYIADTLTIDDPQGQQLLRSSILRKSSKTTNQNNPNTQLIELYSEGDEIEYFYIIQSGSLWLRRKDAKEAIKQYGPGDLLGFEEGDSTKRIFTCVGVKNQDTIIYAIKKKIFLSYLRTPLLTFFQFFQQATLAQLKHCQEQVNEGEDEYEEIENRVKWRDDVQNEQGQEFDQKGSKSQQKDQGNQEMIKRKNGINNLISNRSQQAHRKDLNLHKYISSNDSAKLSFKRIVSENSNSSSTLNSEIFPKFNRNNNSNGLLSSSLFPSTTISNYSAMNFSSTISQQKDQQQQQHQLLPDNMTSLSQLKNPFKQYDRLLTFSNVYHKRKNIIAVSLSKESQLKENRNVNTSNIGYRGVSQDTGFEYQRSLMIHEQVPLRGFEEEGDSQEIKQIKFMGQFSAGRSLSTMNLRNATEQTNQQTGNNTLKHIQIPSSSFKSDKHNRLDNPFQITQPFPRRLTPTKVKQSSLNIHQIEIDVERQLLNIPKSYQDKLWGKNGFEALSHTFFHKR